MHWILENHGCVRREKLKQSKENTKKSKSKIKRKRIYLMCPNLKEDKEKAIFHYATPLLLFFYLLYFNYHDKVTSTILNSQLWKTPKSHNFIQYTTSNYFTY